MFHPHARAYWQPAADALLGALIGGLAGGLISDWIGLRVIAGVCMLVFFFASYFIHHEILLRSYSHSRSNLSTTVPPDEDTWQLWRTTASDGRTLKLIYGLPVKIAQLVAYARGMVRTPPMSTVYDAWYGVFTQPEYSLFRDWLLDNDFMRPIKRGQIEITPWGDAFFTDIVERGVEPHNPAPVMTVQQVRLDS